MALVGCGGPLSGQRLPADASDVNATQKSNPNDVLAGGRDSVSTNHGRVQARRDRAMIDPVAPSGLIGAGHPALRPSVDLALAASLLGGADLADPVADRHRGTVMDFVTMNPDAAERSCPQAHLTGSALVVDATGTRTILMLHRKLRRWFQPGGHADGDTNLAAVALKEATEETGITGLKVLAEVIDVDVHRVAPPGEDEHLHLDVRFLVVAPPGASEVANHESLGLRWVDPDELDDLIPSVDASTRRLVEIGLTRARQLMG